MDKRELTSSESRHYVGRQVKGLTTSMYHNTKNAKKNKMQGLPLLTLRISISGSC